MGNVLTYDVINITWKCRSLRKEYYSHVAAGTAPQNVQTQNLKVLHDFDMAEITLFFRRGYFLKLFSS